MATTEDSLVQIAGIGHVYTAVPDTPAPDLWAYTFGDGSTLDASGWTWLGDTSSENLIEFDSDGGDTSTVRTWDRKDVRSTREAVTNKITINAVSLGAETMEIAFPGSTYIDAEQAWDLALGADIDKAVLVVIEDAGTVSGMLFRRVNISGSLPTVALDKFTEVKLSGTLLSSPSGKTKMQFLEPRKATGKATAKPTLTSVAPATGVSGSRVTLNGTHFDGVRSVKFGARNAAFEKKSDTQIVATVPQMAAGVAQVTVGNGFGASEGKEFTVK